MGDYCKFCIFFLIVIFSKGVHAQPSVNHPAFTIANVDSLNTKGYKLIRNDATRALLLFVKAEQLSNTLHYNAGLITAYVNQAEVFNQHGFYKRALLLYTQAIGLSKRFKDDYYYAQCQQHISTVRRNLGDYEGAKKLLNSALSVFVQLRKPVDVVNVQLRLGLVAAGEKKYAKAQTLYDQAYRGSKAAKYQYGEKKSYYNRALLLEDVHQPDSALHYLHLALRIDTLTNDRYGKALSYIEVSRIYMDKHNLTAAGDFARSAFMNADSASATDLAITAAGLLVDINKQLHSDKGVIQWQNQLISIDQRIDEQKRKDAITFIDVIKQQQDNQEKYINQLNAVRQTSSVKNNWLIGCCIVLIIIVLAGIAINRNYRSTKTLADALKVINQQIADKSAAVEQLNTQILTQNKSLEQDNHLKNKLLSVISHDLRHPLVNSRSLLQLYNQHMMTEAEAKPLFQQLEGQYVRTITLLDNLLFWIKRQVRHEEAYKMDNQVHQLIDDLIEEQRITISNKNISVHNRVLPEVIWHTDREALRIVFRNLLNNALKFTPDNGVIEFTSACTGQLTSITVRDSGIGMGKSKLQKVIEGSYMSTNGTAGEMGSGFGLILIRDLITNEGGKLDIVSEPGAGSAFTITFEKQAV